LNIINIKKNKREENKKDLEIDKDFFKEEVLLMHTEDF
jgi:hypothetical protein